MGEKKNNPSAIGRVLHLLLLFPGSPSGLLVLASHFIFIVSYFAKYLRAIFTILGAQRALSVIHFATRRA